MKSVRGRGQKYPAVERLFAAKEKRRRELAALPIEDKLAIAFEFEEMLRPIRRWREGRSGLKKGFSSLTLKRTV
jgi:hypothetical protein